MAAEWFYRQGAEQFGPCSGHVIRALAKDGAIVPTTPIRKADDAKWIKAVRIKGLFDAVEPVPCVAELESHDDESPDWTAIGHMLDEASAADDAYQAESQVPETPAACVPAASIGIPSNEKPMADRASELRSLIESLISQIEQAKLVVQSWMDASSSVSQSAAEARAKNQSMGRDIVSILAGAKYRARERRVAAACNADIAVEVAEKRAVIATKKREARDLVKALKAKFATAKKDLVSATSHERDKLNRQAASVKAATDSLSLLQKLKEAHDLGLLTDEEYEQKRRVLVSRL